MTELEICNKAMSNGFVKFTYKKVNGSLRTAIGTRNSSVIESLVGSNDENDKRNANPLLYAYYDLGKGEWRCFRVDLFIGICYGKNGVENMCKESACIYALTTAIKEDNANVERVLNNIRSLLGNEMTSKLVNYICDHKDEDYDIIEQNCLFNVFNMAESTPIEPPEVAETKETIIERLITLMKEESRLRTELDDIVKKKDEILSML